MKVVNWLKKVLISVHEWVQKKWLIVSILMSTSSIWFSLILNFYGEKFSLIVTGQNGDRQFTRWGAFLTFFIIAFSLLLAMAQRYYEYSKLSTDRDKRKLVILEKVDLETSNVCDNKYITLKKRIMAIKRGEINELPQIVSRPCEQLKHITSKINCCLCKLLTQKEYDIREDELYVSLYYKFPFEDNVWKLADSLSPEKGLSIDELMDEKSTFSAILKSKETFIFFNSKEHARKSEHYIKDEEDNVDENDELKGSIGCYKIDVKEDNKKLIEAVLCITTYSKRFVNDNDKKTIDNVKYNMAKYVLKPFVKRIQIELCLLYLSVLYEKQVL